MTGAGDYTFDFTADRIPPFYTEPCDWCQLAYQQLTIPRTWKLQSYFLPRVPNCRPPSMSVGMWHDSLIPFWALSYDLSPFCHPKDPMIPKNPPASSHTAMNYDRSLPDKKSNTRNKRL